MRRCTVSIEPTSRPRVGCEAISTLSGRESSTRNHDLLLVSARERARRRARRTRTDIELLDALRAVGEHGRRVEAQQAAAVRRAVVQVEHEVLGNRETEHQPLEPAVLGDVPDTRRGDLMRAVAGDVDAADLDAARRGLEQPDQRTREFGLPVALHAGDRKDLPGTHLEREVVHREGSMIAIDCEAADRQRHYTGSGGRLGHVELDRTSDHHLGERRVIGLGGVVVPTTLPSRITVIRSATSSTSPSLWVMKSIECPSARSDRITVKSSALS